MIDVNLQELLEWINKSRSIFIKKLARNDWAWANGREFGHQNGVYIPSEIRESDFFPTLESRNPDRAHIFEREFNTLWPATGEMRRSKLKHYSNKGSEMHFTGVPKDHFSELTPASWLVGGQQNKGADEIEYWFFVVDSDSEAAAVLESLFDLSSGFHFGLFDPMDARGSSPDEVEDLIDQISRHLRAGTLASFIASVIRLPSPHELAVAAQNEYILQHGLSDLNPYKIDNPGDAVMQISRDIEYRLYKRAELRHRAAEVVRIITEHGPDIVHGAVRGFADLDSTFLSASQHRRSRAGRSFEQHIGRLFRDGDIIYEEQAVTGGRRPDFVLPDLAALDRAASGDRDALIVSAKTTLRERWKQLALEKFDCDLFLATVDDRVSADAIDDMETQGICLIVPESLKNSRETCYKDKANVITFSMFFECELKRRRPYLIHHPH